MNYSLSSFELEPNKIINIYTPHEKENLTTWGIFLSSLLLSIGGLFSMVMASIRNSKCKNVKCCGVGCVRDLEQV
tara:strand:- start:662 stop:886 length:225 start_codon:yes stop_codon:yes gene_type:complete